MSFDPVHDRMMELEAEHGGDHAPVGVVMARMLGAEHSEQFDEAVQAEVKRAWDLGRDWYGKLGLESSIGNVLAIGMLQGVTLAVAHREVADG